MFGVGAQEFAIIIVIAVLLFGAPVITFLFGYSLGRKRAAAGSETAVAEKSSADE